MKKIFVYDLLIVSIFILIIFLVNFNKSFKDENIEIAIDNPSTTKIITSKEYTTTSSTKVYTTTAKTNNVTTSTKRKITTKTTSKATTKRTSTKTTTKDKEISLKKEEEIASLKLEEYIIGVVACEIPASFNIEALKAQAVASRTYAVYKMEASNKDYDVVATIDDQCYISQEDMKSKWGSTYNKYYKIVKDAVDSTKGIVMHKNNKLFKAFYFSTSNGKTRDSQTVFSEGNIISVDSSWDKQAKNYEVTTVLTKAAMVKILGSFDFIQIKKRDADNNVTSICVDTKCYTGIEFRKKMNLRSTDFTIDIQNNNYVITTKGYGHGVGMSQYGANYLAEKGKDYTYILNYYYNNVEFINY